MSRARFLVANESQLRLFELPMTAAAAKVLERPNAVPLTEADVGASFLIAAVDGSEVGTLRDLGFCESLQVKKLADGRRGS